MKVRMTRGRPEKLWWWLNGGTRWILTPSQEKDNENCGEQGCWDIYINGGRVERAGGVKLGPPPAGVAATAYRTYGM